MAMFPSLRVPGRRRRVRGRISIVLAFTFFIRSSFRLGKGRSAALRATAATRQVPQNGGTPSSLRLRAAARSARPRQHRPRAKFLEGLLSEQQHAYGAQRARAASSGRRARRRHTPAPPPHLGSAGGPFQPHTAKPALQRLTACMQSMQTAGGSKNARTHAKAGDASRGESTGQRAQACTTAAYAAASDYMLS